MAIRNKAVEGFSKNCQKDEEEESLYRQFKRTEMEIIAFLQGKNSVLEESTSYTAAKKKLVQLAGQIFVDSSLLEIIEEKRLDERFWVLIKKELRKTKAEKKNKASLSGQYFENISKNKDCVAGIIKTAWPVLEPLKEPHFHDSFIRKLFGKFFLMLGEILKQKYKADKSILNEVKEFYMRSNKIYSFSARCQELLAMTHSFIGDLFGAVYWYTRSLSLPVPANSKDKLIAVYEELRLKWEKHSIMTKVSSQPAWHVSFCLSFLRIQGIFLTGVNTENLQFLFRICSEHMETYLKKNENSVLLVSMVVIWIFSTHISQKPLSELASLVQHDVSLFDSPISAQCELVIDLFSRFILALLKNVNCAESPWLSPVLIFLYWVSSYRHLPGLFIKDLVRAELFRVVQLIPDDLSANCHLLLPEDLTIIGFLPLHFYYLGQKDFFNNQSGNEESVARLKAFRDISQDILEGNLQITQEKSLSEDEFFGLGQGEFDYSGLMFEEKDSKKIVVVDGPSVAVRHGNGSFSCKGLRIVVNYFSAKGFDVKVVVPEQYLQDDRAEEGKFRPAKSSKGVAGVWILKDLDEQGFLIKTPPMDYDDSYCLQYARSKDGVIVSNNKYWDHARKNLAGKDWISDRTCSFTFAGDEFIPNPDFVFI